ncbi:HxlR family transcriptional regulator [Sphingomonas faeni]|uniref:HxlR family transcriptional regulator n=2 Tax=Sphingomonas faeni TaxID=185950 RepID=A0A2T5U5L1_9SPHN|nr:HxlR family transcriptional regulator [Sphingomonas faeni]
MQLKSEEHFASAFYAVPLLSNKEDAVGKLREPLLECSLPAALEAMGERWSFLILRASFNGLHHFEEFQSELGIARNILANRLARLVEHGILERRTIPEDRRKIAYGLTDKGFALLPTMIALRQWGERWETCVPAFPILVDARDRRPLQPVSVRSHDGRVLSKGDLIWALPGEVAGDGVEAEAAE